MKKIGIIFDMDGTLWDSASKVAESWTSVVQKKYKKDMVITEDDVKNVMGKTMDVIADILFPELDKKSRMDLLDACCENENEYLRSHGGIVYEPFEETMQALKALNTEKYTIELYIVSNCQSGYIEAFLDHYDYWNYFEDIECYGNNSQVKGYNIHLIMERNNLDAAIYVGDIQGDYDSACEAKAGFIHAGYGFGTINAQVPRISTIAELPDAVKEYVQNKIL